MDLIQTKIAIHREFKDVFYYDETSPTGLRFLFDNKSSGDKKRYAHDPAGSFRDAFRDGSLRRMGIHVKINGKYQLVHRIIWEILNGPIHAGMVIDHLNGDPWDNRVENLACKSFLHNSQNLKKNIKNTSGAVGVNYVKYKGKVSLAQACIQHNRKIYKKCFSVKNFGYEGCFEMAKQWRDNMIIYLNKNGAMITERHKKDD